jgi:hypothetical protein
MKLLLRLQRNPNDITLFVVAIQLITVYMSRRMDAFPSSISTQQSLPPLSPPPPKTIEDTILWINRYCDRQLLHAVVASNYRFIYRGVTPTIPSVPLLSPSSISHHGMDHTDTTRLPPPQRLDPTIQYELPDLLQLDTYGGSIEALELFQLLEEVLTSHTPAATAVRPSTGHIATTSWQDAALWGVYAASIWPTTFTEPPEHAAVVTTTTKSGVPNRNYAWFRDGGLFYPRPPEFDSHIPKNSTSDTRIAIYQETLRRSIVVDGQNCTDGESLVDALQNEACEILFAARSFLAIPVTFDAELRYRLRQSFLI